MGNIALSTNILIIGKSGVGKSSLLNYIFGKEVASTGAGKPVTKEGIFKETIVMDNNFIVNVYDTWGLEANKADRWKKLILDEVQNHDCSSISEWFHSIFYCISAKSARIEVFEKEILKGLISEGNKVIAVLTHSDVNVSEDTFNAMISELEEIGIENSNIIRVCSIGKKLLSGKTTETFGKEKIIDRILNNLWITIYTKIPNILYKKIDEDIDKWYRANCRYVDKTIKWHNASNNKNLNRVANYINEDLRKNIKSTTREIENKVDEAINYFVLLNKQFNCITTLQLIESKKTDLKFEFSLGIAERLSEVVASIIIGVIPVVNLLIPIAIKDIRRDGIKEKLLESKKVIAYDLKKEVVLYTEYLELLNISK